MEKIKKTTASLWAIAERVIFQLIQFSITIIISRIISPEEYGVMAIAMVFHVITQELSDGGLIKALLYKYTPTEEDYSTVFVFNLIISICMYMGIWLLAPSIANYYNSPSLIWILRTLLFSSIITAFQIVPSTICRINLDFKKITLANLCSSTLGGITGVIIALTGGGVWALVGQILVASFSNMLILSFAVKWIPRFQFNKCSFKGLFDYGYKIYISSLIGSLVNNISSVVIGKRYSVQELGYYNRGASFGTFGYGIILPLISNIFFTTLASKKELSTEEFRSACCKGIKYMAILSFPSFLFIILVANPLINFLLTEKWMPAVIFMQLFCIIKLIMIFNTLNIEIINAKGKSGTTLKINIISLIIRVILILIAVNFGIIYVALAEIVSSMMQYCITVWHTKQEIKLTIKMQLLQIIPILLVTLVSCGVGYLVMINLESLILKILLPVTVAGLLYFLILYFIMDKEFRELLEKYGIAELLKIKPLNI